MKKHPTKFAGYYITEDGKVYRKSGKGPDSFRHLVDSEGFIEVNQNERGGNLNDGRYLSVNITLRDERGNFIRQIKYYTHRLVAETLIENTYNLSTVNHIDNNKKNNNVSNLEWLSQSDNWNKSAPILRDYNGRWLSHKKFPEV
jgi:hypothetical protein